MTALGDDERQDGLAPAAAMRRPPAAGVRRA